jgi:pimeloyl-ACP methyl ester carboxylesterase
VRSAALLVAVLAALAFARASSPASSPQVLSERCLTKAERKHAVSFRTTDGFTLGGVVLGRGSVGVVLGHEKGGDLCNWLPFARVLAGSGYRVLALDFRGHGSSQLVRANLKAFRLDRDFLAAAKLLRARGATRTVLMGASMGGTGALVAAAAMQPQPATVVVLSSPTDFSTLDARPAVARVHSPTLYAVGKDDFCCTQEMRDLYDAASAPVKHFELFDTGAHGTQLLKGSTGTQARELILRFLADNVR